jgi:hypothetical protein
MSNFDCLPDVGPLCCDYHVGVEEGRKMERAAIVAWLRARSPWYESHAKKIESGEAEKFLVRVTNEGCR